MKGKAQQRPIILQMGRALAQAKHKSRKQAYSLLPRNSQNTKLATLSTAPQIYQIPEPSKRKITIAYPSKINSNSLISGMNDEFLFMRKQNHLNTCFNVRKNKLKQISKENKYIYKRLNSQKSIYSSAEFDKSFEENNQLKKRLSHSKLSNRLNSSRSSSRGSLASGQHKRIQPKKKDPIQIKASNIKDANGKLLRGFQGLFLDRTELNKSKQSKIPQKSAYSSIKKCDDFPNSLSQSYRNTVPTIANNNQREIPLKMGGILHRIAEVMYSGQQKIQPKIKGYLKPKKTFVF